MPPLERNLQAALLQYLKKLRQGDPTLVYRKKHGTAGGIAGDPDLYGCWRGVPFAIELKRPGEDPTELQRYHLNEWQAAGAVTGVARSRADLARILAEVAARRAPSH